MENFRLSQPTKRSADKINERGKMYNIARAMVMNDVMARENQTERMRLEADKLASMAMMAQAGQKINEKFSNIDLRMRLLDNQVQAARESQPIGMGEVQPLPMPPGAGGLPQMPQMQGEQLPMPPGQEQPMPEQLPMQ